MVWVFETSIDGRTLPRSIRWMIQLDIIKIPPNANNGEVENDHDILLEQIPGENLHDHSLTTLNKENNFIIGLKRDRFDDLARMHEKSFEESQNELDFSSGLSEERCAPLDILADDPLTAIVKQQEALKDLAAARKKSLQRKRVKKGGLYESSADRLSIIKKDIMRIDTEHAQKYHQHINEQRLHNGLDPQDFSTSVEMRSSFLMKVLFLHSEKHGAYYQGFHELCSSIMYVIEYDLLEAELNTGSMQTDDEGDSRGVLLNRKFLLHDTFAVFEALMSHLTKCYMDSGRISNEVVSKIPYVACDKELYNLIQAVPMEHEVYCSRWIRLMMSREVVGLQLTFELWDIFMDLISKEATITSKEQSYYSLIGPEKIKVKIGGWELEQVLEMTAASLIWLKRESLLLGGADHALEILVTAKPLEDVHLLVDTLLLSLHRVQTNQHMAPLALPPTAKNEKLKKKNLSSVKSLKDLMTPFRKNGFESTPNLGGRSLGMQNASFNELQNGSMNSPSSESPKINIGSLRNIMQLKPNSRSQRRAADVSTNGFDESSLKHRRAFHRDTCIQRLVDTSTAVSTLIDDDSDEEEDEESEESGDDAITCTTESSSETAIDDKCQGSSSSSLVWPFPQEERKVESKVETEKVVERFRRRGSSGLGLESSIEECKTTEPIYEQELQPMKTTN
mmetsp:Transcript_18311/g.27673  ORF Transcript_18311/g.27673 Transcript_18311/m.27673 type:complete len:678 (+) Transcript_18311:128-2161(+)